MPLSSPVKERIASISEIQRNPSKALQGITRVMRGSKTIGFFVSMASHTRKEYDDLLENLLEDLEAANSPTLKKRLAKAKRALKDGTGIPFEEVAKAYGL